MFGVPVINASKNWPHKYCNFNINPKSKSEYWRILLNLKKVKNLKINSNEIYQYYFMKFIYNNNNWLINDYKKVFKKVNGINGLNNPIFYKYFDKNYDSNKLSKKVNMVRKFIKSGQYSICNNDISDEFELNLNKKYTKYNERLIMNILITGGTGSFGKKFTTNLLSQRSVKNNILSRDEFKQDQMNNEFRLHKI